MSQPQVRTTFLVLKDGDQRGHTPVRSGPEALRVQNEDRDGHSPISEATAGRCSKWAAAHATETSLVAGNVRSHLLAELRRPVDSI